MCPGQYPTTSFIETISINGNSRQFYMSTIVGGVITNDGFVIAKDDKYKIDIIFSNLVGNCSKISRYFSK